MKIKEGYLLRNVADSTVVVPLNDTMTFHGMIKLNDTGRFLWEKLQEEQSREDLLSALCATYEIDAETAGRDLDGFIDHLREMGVMTE